MWYKNIIFWWCMVIRYYRVHIQINGRWTVYSHDEQGGPIKTSTSSTSFSIRVLPAPPSAPQLSSRHITLKGEKQYNSKVPTFLRTLLCSFADLSLTVHVQIIPASNSSIDMEINVFNRSNTKWITGLKVAFVRQPFRGHSWLANGTHLNRNPNLINKKKNKMK